MLYHLLYPLHASFSAFNVFRYITFRAIYASLTAFIICFLLGPWVIKRLRQMQVGSAEYTVVRTYIDWILDLPWMESTEDNLDLKRAEKVLNRVREHALARFSDRNIRIGRPHATLEEVLVPIYLLHRYQLQAVGKLIGGQYFSYTLRGDGQSEPETVDAEKQWAAINALLVTRPWVSKNLRRRIVANVIRRNKV